MSALSQFLKSGKYLPKQLRDFHDQKEVFKTIHELVGHEIITRAGTQKPIDWITAQIYTVDVFLWFMAKRGYTLQKCRAKVDFFDLDKTVRDQTAKRDAMFMAAMKQGLSAAPEAKL